ncbi:uncharacterized protein with HEPN domain [Mucilaginibacter dorajii]|nr:uncharacterized protein with HEPN domain [Mucilaginibacter dorajii]
MKGKMGDRQRLLHILEAIDEINNYTLSTDLKSFLENSMMRFACVKQIEILAKLLTILLPKIKRCFLIWNGSRSLA